MRPPVGPADSAPCSNICAVCSLSGSLYLGFFILRVVRVPSFWPGGGAGLPGRALGLKAGGVAGCRCVFSTRHRVWSPGFQCAGLKPCLSLSLQAWFLFLKKTSLTALGRAFGQWRCDWRRELLAQHPFPSAHPLPPGVQAPGAARPLSWVGSQCPH